MQFNDGTVVLTGVGREGQVGEVVARTLAERGATIVAIDRLEADVHARVEELQALGFRASAHVCDLTDEAQVQAVADSVRVATAGKVSALVNLAGGFAMSGPVAESEVAAWHRQLAINLTTGYLTTRAFLPLIRAARGSVVFFASAAALPGGRVKGMAAYAAAKSGVVALMRAVAEEERANGVRANALAPTAIRTATNVASMGDDAKYVEREEVAELVAWLCSDTSRPLSGQVLAL